MLTNGTLLGGEWVQLSLPERIFLNAYALYTHEIACGRNPSTFHAVGSNDGITWTLLSSVFGETRWNTATPGDTLNFPSMNTTSSFSIFRIVISRVGACSSCDTANAELAEASFLGVADTFQPTAASANFSAS